MSGILSPISSDEVLRVRFSTHGLSDTGSGLCVISRVGAILGVDVVHGVDRMRPILSMAVVNGVGAVVGGVGGLGAVLQVDKEGQDAGTWQHDGLTGSERGAATLPVEAGQC